MPLDFMLLVLKCNITHLSINFNYNTLNSINQNLACVCEKCKSDEKECVHCKLETGVPLPEKKLNSIIEDTSNKNMNREDEDESPEEAHFRKHVFYVVLDNVIGGLTVRFNEAKQISDTFSFLWNYQKMSELRRGTEA